MKKIQLVFVSDEKRVGYILDLDKDQFVVGLAEGDIDIPEPHKTGSITSPKDVGDKIMSQINSAVRSTLNVK